MPTSLSQKRILFLWKRYVEHSGVTADDANLAQFNLFLDVYEVHEIKDYLPLVGISGKKHKEKEQMDDWQLFRVLADKCFDKKQKSIVFNETKANNAFKTEIERHKNSSGIYTAHANGGIVIKYRARQLRVDEWLTDLDLTSWLNLAGVGDQVIVTPFDSVSLGAALSLRLKPYHNIIKQYNEAVIKYKKDTEEHKEAIKKHKNDTEEYKEAIKKYQIETEEYQLIAGMHEEAIKPFELYALVSLVGNVHQTGSHWIALKFEVNPANKSVRYYIEDSMSGRGSSDKKVVEQALRYNDIEAKQQTFSNEYSITGEVKGTRKQSDGYSCGYRALFCIVKYLKDFNSPLIQEYSQTPEISKELVKTFYKGLLEDQTGWNEFKKRFDAPVLPSFRKAFEQPIFRFSPREVVSNPNPGPINFTSSSSSSSSSSSTIHSDVFKSLDTSGEYNLNENDLTEDDLIFDNSDDFFDTDQTLEFIQFFDKEITKYTFEKEDLISPLRTYLDALDKKLKQIDHTLEKLVIADASMQTLDDLASYFEHNPNTRLRHVKIKLGDIIADERFQTAADALRYSLRGVISEGSNTNIESLTFEEKNPSPSSLWNAVVTDSDAKVTINLPVEQRKSDLQYAIDMTVRKNQARKKLYSPDTTSSIRKKVVPSSLNNKRQRFNALPVPQRQVELTQKESTTLKVETKREPTIRGYNYHFWLQKLELENNITKQQLDECWLNIFGRFRRESPSQYTEKMTQQALDKVIEYADYFKEGINPNFLPEGFTWIMEGEQIWVLHYDPSISNKNGATPVLPKKRQAMPLNFEICDTLFKQGAFSEGLTALWITINNVETYDRDAIKILVKCANQLLDIDQSDLEHILEYCKNQKGAIIPEILDSILTHFHVKEPNIEKASATLGALVNKHHGIITDSRRFIETIPFLKSANDTTNHPVYLLFNDRSDTLNRPDILKSLKEYDLNRKQLDAVLEVASVYEPHDVAKLLKLWDGLDVNTRRNMLSKLYKDPGSFVFMLQDQRFINVFEVIKGFSKNPNKALWWNTLLNLHNPSQPYDLVSLAENFAAFADRVDELGLVFDVPDFQQKSINMPFFLGRMLEVINRCDKRDIDIQWSCITQIPLETSILPGLDNLNEMGFVIPAMYPNPGSNPYFFQQKANFYRKVARESQRLPLAFYIDVENFLMEKKCSTQELIMWYEFLHKTTTGKNADGLTSQKALQYVEKIYKNLQLSDTYSRKLFNILSGAYQSDNESRQFNSRMPSSLASAAIFSDLKYAASHLRWGDWQANVYNTGVRQYRRSRSWQLRWEFKRERMNRHIVDFCDEFSLRWGDSFYDGFKHYKKITYSRVKLPMLYHHIQLVDQITKSCGQNYALAPAYAALIGLISAFKITKDDPSTSRFRMTVILDDIKLIPEHNIPLFIEVMTRLKINAIPRKGIDVSTLRNLITPFQANNLSIEVIEKLLGNILPKPSVKPTVIADEKSALNEISSFYKSKVLFICRDLTTHERLEFITILQKKQALLRDINLLNADDVKHIIQIYQYNPNFNFNNSILEIRAVINQNTALSSKEVLSIYSRLNESPKMLTTKLVNLIQKMPAQKELILRLASINDYKVSGIELVERIMQELVACKLHTHPLLMMASNVALSQFNEQLITTNVLTFDPEHRKFVIELLIQSISRNDIKVEPFKAEKFKSLLHHWEENKAYVGFLQAIYADHWSVSINDVLNRCDHPSKFESYLIDSQNKTYKNDRFIGFKAKQVVNTINDNHQSNIVNENELAPFQEAIAFAKTAPTVDMLNSLKLVRQGTLTLPNHVFLAYVAELLNRLDNAVPLQDSRGSNNIQYIRGLNTTQYISALTMLNQGSKVFANLPAGEDAKPLLAVLAACEFLRGNTVDLVVGHPAVKSSAAVQSMYQRYAVFFEALGERPGIAMASTDMTQYQPQGINIVDANHLILLRNQSRVEGTHDAMMHPDKTKRALIMNNADSFFFDTDNVSYTYTAANNEVDMSWVYPLLIRYFYNNPENCNQYIVDIDGCTSGFMQFVAQSTNGLERLQSISKVTKDTMETWLQSAFQVLQFQFKTDYVIKTDSSGAQALIKGKDGEQFANGMQQCLHAFLNLRKSQLVYESAQNELDDVLLQSASFKVENQKPILYSSSFNDFVNDYSQSNIKAISTSIRTEAEHEELKNAHKELQFIALPSNQPGSCQVLPLDLVANQDDQFEQIAEHIAKAKQDGLSVVIYCKDDNESNDLYRFLSTQDKNISYKLLSSNTAVNEVYARTTENEVVISSNTSFLYTPTNIRLPSSPNFYVMSTYIPSLREGAYMTAQANVEAQGKDHNDKKNNGEVRYVVTTDSLPAQISVKNLLISGESTILEHQLIENRKRQVNRMVNNILFEMKATYTQFFFEQLPKLENKNQMMKKWKVFSDKMESEMANTRMLLAPSLLGTFVVINRIGPILKDFGKNIDKAWSAMELDKPPITPIKVNERLFQDFVIANYVEVKAPVSAEYDPAFAGRAVLYTTWSARFAAFFDLFADFRAWLGGKGMLFPNVSAWWNNQMSFGELITGFSSTPEKTKSVLFENAPLVSATRIFDLNREQQQQTLKPRASQSPAIVEPKIPEAAVVSRTAPELVLTEEEQAFLESGAVVPTSSPSIQELPTFFATTPVNLAILDGRAIGNRVASTTTIVEEPSVIEQTLPDEDEVEIPDVSVLDDVSESGSTLNP